MKRFEGQTVFITGAAGAIGKQLALQFQRRGAKLGLTDNNASALEDLKKELALHMPAACAVADITDRTAIAAALHSLEQQLGPVDIMIANAGVAWNNPIAGFDARIFAQQVEINLIGMAYCLEPVISGMIARRRGHIVALSSLASYRGLPHMAGYCASKAGVSAFLDSLRIELKPFG
ncbi:MAG TPA: SDR family NAD(P)-dependent oxidoreductase, partial [Gemmatales bacterium]|nr:SDR family NAD(P)-dependent oxidoreductase [Gemmatales bacterium]